MILILVRCTIFKSFKSNLIKVKFIAYVANIINIIHDVITWKPKSTEGFEISKCPEYIQLFTVKWNQF